jgi:hypothetical protein
MPTGPRALPTTVALVAQQQAIQSADAADDQRTQQKFIDAAREVGAETDRDAFRSIVRKIATATSSTESKGKKAAKKRKAT